MTDPDAVARALSRLATGSVATVEPQWPNSERPSRNPERVVADAEASMERVDRATAFLAGGGESRLRWAIQCADASDDDELAARGRAVVTALAAFRAAASDGDERCEHTSSPARTTSTAFAQRSSGGES